MIDNALEAVLNSIVIEPCSLGTMTHPQVPTECGQELGDGCGPIEADNVVGVVEQVHRDLQVFIDVVQYQETVDFIRIIILIMITKNFDDYRMWQGVVVGVLQ